MRAKRLVTLVAIALHDLVDRTHRQGNQIAAIVRQVASDLGKLLAPSLRGPNPPLEVRGLEAGPGKSANR